MSKLSFNEIKNDLKQVTAYWKSQNPTIRLLDTISIACVLIFGVGFLFVYAFDIPVTVTNMAFLIFPVIVAGYTYVFRSKLSDQSADHQKARKEYITLISISFALVVLTFVYSFLEA